MSIADILNEEDSESGEEEEDDQMQAVDSDEGGESSEQESEGQSEGEEAKESRVNLQFNQEIQFEDLADEFQLIGKEQAQKKKAKADDDLHGKRNLLRGHFKKNMAVSFVGGALSRGFQAVNTLKESYYQREEKKDEDLFVREEVKEQDEQEQKSTKSEEIKRKPSEEIKQEQQETKEAVQEENKEEVEAKDEGKQEDEGKEKKEEVVKEEKKEEDSDSLDEEENKRILADLENEDDEDDEDDEGEDEEEEESEKQKSEEEQKSYGMDDSSSILTEDIVNRSLDDQSATLGSSGIIDPNNYLKYVNEKFTHKQDVLEVVDRNERSFKHVAEHLILQSSQLVNLNDQQMPNQSGQDQGPRRLMHFKPLMYIADKYNDGKSNQGVPYSIAAFEEFLAVGSSDGTIRLYDNMEKELKVLYEKGVKGAACLSIDLKRICFGNLFVVAGYAKGQITLFEVKGLGHNYEYGNVTYKHHRTITDIHQNSVLSIKFFGEIGSEVNKFSVISCDLDGVVYLTYFTESFIGFNCNKQCFMKKRIGAVFSLSAHIIQSEKTLYDYLESTVLEEEENQQVEGTNQLVAFGALERIIIAQVAPKPEELKCMDRPEYIEYGTVPYLDWGYGLSPSYRDKRYPMLAVVWGKVLQLLVFVNFDKGPWTRPNIVQDGFYMCDGFTIDACFFLSDSMLFTIVNKKEVRILYTQNFTPGVFEDGYSTLSKNLAQIERKKLFHSLKEKYSGQVSAYAEKDKGYRLLQEEIKHKDMLCAKWQQKSKFNFNQTICRNERNLVYALGKANIGMGKLISWEEYLDLIRKTNPNDWLKVLKAALDIFNGKIIGLSGLPDVQETREALLRERMKDLLRQNIDACIKEFQEGECVSSKTVRVALEFCIRVGAISHLFGELFQMFAEAGMEQNFFTNMEVFILSGKLKNTKIPDNILLRMVDYYKQKDMELLEKALLNIDLTTYNNVLEIRHICETEFLTSALIHIMTTVFDGEKDNTICMHLLCSLFSMIQKSKMVKEKSEMFKLALYEKQNLSSGQQDAGQKVEKWEKREIENSQTYIGYKLLWLIKLFLEGKKFPNGSLTAFKWRIYVYDIVKFLTNERFMRFFLDFDADCYFQLMKMLFLEQEPFEFLHSQKNFMIMYKDQIQGLEGCIGHQELIETLHKHVQAYIENERIDPTTNSPGPHTYQSEAVHNAFIFFISQIARKQKLEIPESLCQYNIREQLKFHRKMLKIPGLFQLVQSKFVLPSQAQNANVVGGHNKKDKATFIYNQLIKKNEKDVLSLLSRLDTELEEAEITQILEQAENSPMFKVRVHLNQLLGNYQRCLQMYFQIHAIRQDIFLWLRDVEQSIRNGQDFKTLEQMKSLILQNVNQFVEMNPVQTIRICELWFESDHMKLIDALGANNQRIFDYIEQLLKEKEEVIAKEYNQVIMSGFRHRSALYNDYKLLILKFVEILCEKKFRLKLVDYVKKKYFPIAECLKICEEKKMLEAQAVLTKRKGEYRRSIELYLQVLKDLSKKEVISALYVNANIKFGEQSVRSEHIRKFDSLLAQIMHIGEKYGVRLPEEETEALWLFSINGLYGIKGQVFAEMKNLKAKDQNNFSLFLIIRIQAFMKKMSEFVNLRKIIQFFEDIGQPIKYQEFKQTFEDKVKTERDFENILQGSDELLQKDLIAENDLLGSALAQGGKNEKDQCDHCKRFLLNQWDEQELTLFVCGHIFHKRCANQSDNYCSICFTSFEEILLLLTQRGIRRNNKKATQLEMGKGEAGLTRDAETVQKQQNFFQTKRDRSATNKVKRPQKGAKQQPMSRNERIMRDLNQFDLDLDDDHLKLENF